MTETKEIRVLAECVDIRTGKRFQRGEIFRPLPTVDQAKRLIKAECLPEEALDVVLAAQDEAGKVVSVDTSAKKPAGKKAGTEPASPVEPTAAAEANGAASAAAPEN